MNTVFRFAAVALLLATLAGPASAQPRVPVLPEPLPMGVPYVYQPGNNYWYAPALPIYAPAVPTYFYGPVWVAPVFSPVWVAPVVRVGHGVRYTAVVYPYPFASSGPVYGRYSWDYTGQYTAGYGWYSTSVPHYPYSYQYPTLAGRVWMGYGW